MARIVISSATGINQFRDGHGIEFDSAPIFSQTPTLQTSGLTAAGSVTVGGLYTVSGNTAVTTTMPLASSVPGATFIFRNISAQAHALTGSAEAQGTLVFTDGTSHGSKLALSAVVGNSVVLMSDGVNFCVLGNSGSLTINGT